MQREVCDEHGPLLFHVQGLDNVEISSKCNCEDILIIFCMRG